VPSQDPRASTDDQISDIARHQSLSLAGKNHYLDVCQSQFCRIELYRPTAPEAIKIGVAQAENDTMHRLAVFWPREAAFNISRSPWLPMHLNIPLYRPIEPVVQWLPPLHAGRFQVAGVFLFNRHSVSGVDHRPIVVHTHLAGNTGGYREFSPGVRFLCPHRCGLLAYR
jgi:hypothetical protein